jgi:hypothetical protein
MQWLMPRSSIASKALSTLSATSRPESLIA